MGRENYNEIKDGFTTFINTWKTKDLATLETVIMPDVKCYMSTVKAYNSGAQHSLYGVRDFVADLVDSDVFHYRICNFACRIFEQTARQGATVVFRAAVLEGEEGIRSVEFSAMFSTVWAKTAAGWKMNEIRMDVVDCDGDFNEYFEHWHFEDSKAKWYQGVHLPVISGELDSPWLGIPQTEDVLTEEEKILDGFYKYAFGIDTLSFSHVDPVFTEDFVAIMDPWGNLDKRGFLTTIKYHRQSNRYWTHTVVPESINIDGDQAEVRLYRMAGHKQRNHPLVITRENVDAEYACARYEIKARKEDGEWKVTRVEYYLGIIKIGQYKD